MNVEANIRVLRMFMVLYATQGLSDSELLRVMDDLDSSVLSMQIERYDHFAPHPGGYEDVLDKLSPSSKSLLEDKTIEYCVDIRTKEQQFESELRSATASPAPQRALIVEEAKITEAELEDLQWALIMTLHIFHVTPQSRGSVSSPSIVGSHKNENAELRNVSCSHESVQKPLIIVTQENNEDDDLR